MNDFAAALRDLNEAGVRYVVVGGLAVIRHGAVRATKGVDVAVAMNSANLMCLVALVERWQATNPDGTPLRCGDLRAGGALALRTPHCFVDVLSEQLLPAAFAAVLARCDRKRIDGVEAPICSLADLVAMKRATGRGSDAVDLERLREAHGELPGDRSPGADGFTGSSSPLNAGWRPLPMSCRTTPTSSSQQSLRPSFSWAPSSQTAGTGSPGKRRSTRSRHASDRWRKPAIQRSKSQAELGPVTLGRQFPR